MKTFNLLLTFVCAAFILTGCNKIEYENEFDKSYKKWLKFKSESGGIYQYKTTVPWAGLSWHTIFTVNGERIIQREYQLTKLVYSEGNPIPTVEILDHGIENENEIGSHGYGDFIGTLDDVYREARKEWLKKQKGKTIYFETNNDGMISLCGYRDNDCADDCFVGISIEYIRGYGSDFCDTQLP